MTTQLDTTRAVVFSITFDTNTDEWDDAQLHRYAETAIAKALAELRPVDWVGGVAFVSARPLSPTDPAALRAINFEAVKSELGRLGRGAWRVLRMVFEKPPTDRGGKGRT